MQTKVGRSAVNAGAQVIKRQAVQNVIGEGLVKTGVLRNNIAVKREKTPPGLIQYNVGVRHGRGTKGRTVRLTRTPRGKLKKAYKNDPYYWRFQEFGTKTGAKRHEFLTRAAENNSGRVVDKISEVLKRRIERANNGR